MASDHEPAKILLPYLQRADELQKQEPLVAYYCKAAKTLHPSTSSKNDIAKECFNDDFIAW
ncbi:hypothetical protein CRG98_043105 [Punica granatum]|uniref:Vta1/callose synthase N-terminal domain-containing protein n=1 Tax=Punica granatum TaxID=22663 RepID=A0A2I0HXT4_PUNGR|nr:hypothetical protein CRG98_043105 [Punica granatum]